MHKRDMRRTILLTNDDGIHSDGIIRLARAAVKFGSVWLIAPHIQRSGASHSITVNEPLDIRPVSFEVEGVKAYSCSGMPVDCVRIGCLRLMPSMPDVVLSGINYGFNTATDIQYSATVGAAFEGAFLGSVGIAVSEQDVPCHEVADAYLDEVLEELIDVSPGPDRIWNVNFPGCRLSECAGILRNRAMSHEIVYEDSYDAIEELEGGGVRYMIRGKLRREAKEGTDFHALLNNAVSIGMVTNVS